MSNEKLPKIIEITKEWFKTEDGQVYNFDEPLNDVPNEKELSDFIKNNYEELRNYVFTE
jgi:hypothetical protein